jgi:hypothetical protein
MRVSSDISRVVVDVETWLRWLDGLHKNFPETYADPSIALNGFYDDWEQYCRIIDKIRGLSD